MNYFSDEGNIGISSKLTPIGAFEEFLNGGEGSSIVKTREKGIALSKSQMQPQGSSVENTLGIFGSLFQMNNPFINWLFVELNQIFNGQIPFSELGFLLPDYITHIQDYISAIESNKYFMAMKRETLVILKVVIMILGNIVANNKSIQSNQHFQHFFEALKQFR